MSVQSVAETLNRYFGAIATTATIGIFAFVLQAASTLKSMETRMNNLEDENKRNSSVIVEQTKQLVRIAEIIDRQEERNSNFKDQFRDITVYIDREIQRSVDIYEGASTRLVDQFKVTERELRILQDDYSRLKALVETKLNTRIEH